MLYIYISNVWWTAQEGFPTFENLPENPYWDMVLDYPFENWENVNVTITVRIV